MLVCPLCGQKNELTEIKCTRCGEDLTLYSKVYFAADMLYNKAVDLSNRGETASAVELLLSANKIKPGDADVINLLVELYIKQGDYKNALEKCVLLLDINPADERTNKLLEELSEIINVEDEKRKKLQAFLNKSIAVIYSEVSGEQIPDTEEFIAGMKEQPHPAPEKEVSEDVAAAADMPVPAETGVTAANTGPGREKGGGLGLWPRILICLCASVLIMILGFGAVYWKLSDNIFVQTNTWAKSTEGKITAIAEDLAGKVGQLQADQKDLRAKLDSDNQNLAKAVASLSDQVGKVGDSVGSLSGKYDASAAAIGEIKTQTEEINAEIDRLKAKLQLLQDELLKAAVK